MCGAVDDILDAINPMEWMKPDVPSAPDTSKINKQLEDSQRRQEEAMAALAEQQRLMLEASQKYLEEQTALMEEEKAKATAEEEAATEKRKKLLALMASGPQTLINKGGAQGDLSTPGLLRAMAGGS